MDASFKQEMPETTLHPQSGVFHETATSVAETEELDVDHHMGTEPDSTTLYSHPWPEPDFNTYQGICTALRHTIIMYQPHVVGRQFTPIHVSLRENCRLIFHRDEILFYLAEIYLGLWATPGLQGIRDGHAKMILEDLQKKLDNKDFWPEQEHDITKMALSLNQRIIIYRIGERFGPSGNGGIPTLALVESIVPHSAYLTFWTLRVSLPEIGCMTLEQTEPLRVVVDIISNYY